jgi:hypothetical protein
MDLRIELAHLATELSTRSAINQVLLELRARTLRLGADRQMRI